MSAREELNKAKTSLEISTDQELADILKTNKRNLENWVRRNIIPDKWRMIISHHVNTLAKIPLDNPVLMEESIKANKVENPTLQYGLPVDIANIVEILKAFDTKQRRDVLRFVWELEG
ncbi:MAG: helix-turn-helix domain-containing protein [Bacteroidales bacterium]|nr:helix-turn-helix domain-containing protein [Bacteroidales bacterium]